MNGVKGINELKDGEWMPEENDPAVLESIAGHDEPPEIDYGRNDQHDPVGKLCSRRFLVTIHQKLQRCPTGIRSYSKTAILV